MSHKATCEDRGYKVKTRETDFIHNVDELVSTIQVVLAELHKLLINKDIIGATQLISETEKLLAYVPSKTAAFHPDFSANLATANRLVQPFHPALSQLFKSVYVSQYDFDVELNLVVQPLRAENSNLKRKLRILEHKLKTCNSVTANPIRNGTGLFSTELIRVEELKKENQMLKDSFETVKRKNERLCQELVLSNMKHMKEPTDEAVSELKELKAKLSELEKENLTLKNNSVHKDREVARLKKLALKLQEGMQDLLQHVNRKSTEELRNLFDDNNSSIQSEKTMTPKSNSFNGLINTGLIHSDTENKPINIVEINENDFNSSVRNLEENISSLELSLQSARDLAS